MKDALEIVGGNSGEKGINEKALAEAVVEQIS